VEEHSKSIIQKLIIFPILRCISFQQEYLLFTNIFKYNLKNIKHIFLEEKGESKYI